MDALATKVAHLCFEIKKLTLVPFYAYMNSSRGHKFMKRVGPGISFFFYVTQAMHAYFFYAEVGPALQQLYHNSNPWLVNIWLSLGWLFWVKVTHTYWWVSTADPGTTNTYLS